MGPGSALRVYLRVSLFAVGWGLQWLSARAMLHFPKLHLKPEEQQAVQTLQNGCDLGAPTGARPHYHLLAPVAEEVLFRGIFVSLD